MARQSALRALRAAQLATRRGVGTTSTSSSGPLPSARLLFDIRASAHLLSSVSASAGA